MRKEILIMIGFKFPVIYEVVRAAEDGDMAPNHEGKLIAVDNKRGNKFWARQKYNPSGQEILCCFDALDAQSDYFEGIKKIVEMIEKNAGING